jgi:hypothetical protein
LAKNKHFYAHLNVQSATDVPAGRHAAAGDRHRDRAVPFAQDIAFSVIVLGSSPLAHARAQNFFAVRFSLPRDDASGTFGPQIADAVPGSSQPSTVTAHGSTAGTWLIPLHFALAY